MLKTRLLTAAVITPLVILAIWFLPLKWFSLLATIIVAWCAWEWSTLIGLRQRLARFVYVALIVLMLGITFYVPEVYIFWAALIVWVWAWLGVFSYAKGYSALGFDILPIKALMGFVALIPFWLALNVLKDTSLGPVLLIFALFIVIAVDVGAYFVGRYLGRVRLIPRVSPNKTWEGLIGGLVLAIIVAFIYGYARHLYWANMVELGVLALITGIFAVIGDLYESMQKRQAGVKDSGNILPGHGGILDRLDSVIAALPIFALGLLYLGA